ncbi:hypothetical protein T265_15354, partial [Opisthorchis viverrini]
MVNITNRSKERQWGHQSLDSSRKLERIVLPDIKPKIWVRYVDGTFAGVKKNELLRAEELLNNAFPDIQFTMETKENNKLAFLDVLVTRTTNGQLQTEVYEKETHTDQILNYHSNHPDCHKRSCIRTLFKRIETHCNTTEAKKKEERRLFETFRNNGYPRNFIWRCLRDQHRADPSKQPEQRKITLPYIRNVAMIARHLRQHGIAVAFKPTNMLRRALSKPKGSLDALRKTNVVYKLECNDCDKHYVGQTGRKLATRIHAHKLASRRHDPMSLVSIHEDREGHTFNWDNVQILAHASAKREREFAEAWYSTQKSINKHIDIDPVYQPLRAKGISLTPVVTRLLASVVLRRLTVAREILTREQQAGFRPGRGCVDEIFTMRQVLEQRHTYKRPTIPVFLDYRGAIDSVDRSVLLDTLAHQGILRKFVNILGSLYSRASGRVRVYGELSKSFRTQSGIRQGCPLSPFLFNFVIDETMRRALRGLQNPGVQIACEENLVDLECADGIAATRVPSLCVDLWSLADSLLRAR